MKARLLKKLLNDTKYTVGGAEDYIFIGSPLCHDLISVDKKTMRIKYALDTWHKGKESVKHNDELFFIWEQLERLIVSGEIVDIINGNDEIENPLPVYYYKKGEVHKTFTDAYGWPNVTISGELMYNNTYFKTFEEAKASGIQETTHFIEMLKEQIEEKKHELAKREAKLKEQESCLEKLSSIF